MNNVRNGMDCKTLTSETAVPTRLRWVKGVSFRALICCNSFNPVSRSHRSCEAHCMRGSLRGVRLLPLSTGNPGLSVFRRCQKAATASSDMPWATAGDVRFRNAGRSTFPLASRFTPVGRRSAESDRRFGSRAISAHPSSVSGQPVMVSDTSVRLANFTPSPVSFVLEKLRRRSRGSPWRN